MKHQRFAPAACGEQAYMHLKVHIEIYSRTVFSRDKVRATVMPISVLPPPARATTLFWFSRGSAKSRTVGKSAVPSYVAMIALLFFTTKRQVWK